MQRTIYKIHSLTLMRILGILKEMIRILLNTLLGLGLLSGGFYAGYLFLKSDESAIFLLLLSLGFIGAGIYFLIRAGKSNDSVVAKAKLSPGIGDDPSITKSGVESTLQRNNEMLHSWEKTNNQRDKLKVLQIAGAAEEQ